MASDGRQVASDERRSPLSSVELRRRRATITTHSDDMRSAGSLRRIGAGEEVFILGAAGGISQMLALLMCCWCQSHQHLISGSTGERKREGDMSTVYVLEPPMRVKVVLKTTVGPVDIELWPKAVRNFLQLCLEGYYDRTIFHRVIRSFLVQAGEPTASRTGGESIYGAPFADKFDSRLWFNHRGLVACANAGMPHLNGSQFFITLDRCEWLDKKSTIFGKVTGDSIYNVL